MPAISIVMPVYNVENYLELCIDSVLAQTFNDFELIIVDDGSPDKCPQICDQYATNDDRICVIHKTNGGLSSARNTGISAAKGEYLFMIDSDDVIEPYTLEKAFISAKKHDADLVIVGVEICNISRGRETTSDQRIRPDYVLRDSDIGNHLHELITNSMFNYAWDKLYRLEIIKKNNLKFDSFFDKVCEDTVFLYELLQHLHCISTVPDVCYHYMIRDNQSVVKKYIPQRFEKYVAKLSKFSCIIQGFPDEQEALQELKYQQYVYSVIWSIANLFHQDCHLKVYGRYEFFKWMYKIDSTEQGFRNMSLLYLSRNDTSRGDELLARLYVFGHPLLLTIVVTCLRLSRRTRGSCYAKENTDSRP